LVLLVSSEARGKSRWRNLPLAFVPDGSLTIWYVKSRRERIRKDSFGIVNS